MSIRETRRQTKIIAIISVATALSYVKVFSLPQGGSVTASIVGASVGVFRRFCAHLLSGVVFFASYAPVGMSLIIYSVIYNGSNIIPELLVSVYLIYLLIKSGLIEAYK